MKKYTIVIMILLSLFTVELNADVIDTSNSDEFQNIQITKPNYEKVMYTKGNDGIWFVVGAYNPQLPFECIIEVNRKEYELHKTSSY